MQSLPIPVPLMPSKHPTARITCPPCNHSSSVSIKGLVVKVKVDKRHRNRPARQARPPDDEQVRVAEPGAAPHIVQERHGDDAKRTADEEQHQEYDGERNRLAGVGSLGSPNG